MDTQLQEQKEASRNQARRMVLLQMKLNGVRPDQWKDEWDEPFQNLTFSEWPADLQEFLRPHGGPMVA